MKPCYGCCGFLSKYRHLLYFLTLWTTLKTNQINRRRYIRTLFNRRRYIRLQLVYRIVNDYNCPRPLQGYFVLRSDLRGKVLRDNRELHLRRTKTAMGQSTFMYAAAKEWNDLPNDHRNCSSLKIFKNKLFKFFSDLDKTDFFQYCLIDYCFLPCNLQILIMGLYQRLPPGLR